jgi:hypothetical protein
MIVQFSKEQRIFKFTEVEPGDVFLDNMVVYIYEDPGDSRPQWYDKSQRHPSRRRRV